MAEQAGDGFVEYLRNCEEGYQYVASPYSDPDPYVRQMRYFGVLRATQRLLNRGIWVYSPIVHCHEMAKLFGLPFEAGFWRAYNRAMLVPAKGLIVIRLDGWSQSVGLKEELEISIALKKRITYANAEGETDVTVEARGNRSLEDTPKTAI